MKGTCNLESMPHVRSEVCESWTKLDNLTDEAASNYLQTWIDQGVGLTETAKGVPATRVFPTGATRDTDDSKLDYEGFLSPQVLRLYAEYMHKARLRNVPPGDTIRSSDNWQKGIPKDAYMKSLVRHTMEAWEQHREDGGVIMTDMERDTLCAIIFNVMGYLYEDLNGR